MSALLRCPIFPALQQLQTRPGSGILIGVDLPRMRGGDVTRDHLQGAGRGTPTRRSWSQTGGTVAVMSRAKASYDKAELVELFGGAEPPTDDDVSVTNDGRRLDSAEAVIAFFDELRAQRAGEMEGDGAS